MTKRESQMTKENSKPERPDRFRSWALVPLTALALKQDNYDWGMLAYAVGFGGSMIWFGSSAGVAISNLFPRCGRWAHGSKRDGLPSSLMLWDSWYY